MSNDELTSGEAWRSFCRRLEAIGDRILGDDFPGEPRDRAEGYRHLSRLTVMALQEQMEFSDPEFPVFYRYDDDAVKWGGPNTDNQYLRATIDPSATYRVTGDVRGLREMIISTNEGDMQLEQYRVFAERNLAQLTVGGDGALEIVLSAEEPADLAPGVNWMPLEAGAHFVLVRQYVSDWSTDAVAPLRIERIGNEGRAPAPLTPARVERALDTAATWIEASTTYWNDYMRGARRRLGENRLSPPSAAPGGARDILYGGGFFALAPGEALVVTCDAPEARYWSIQLYNEGWFESLDVANRVNSLNGHQMHVDADGRFRVVISAEDPGVPNWLDTEGYASGMVSYRWVWSRTAPVPETVVVLTSSVRSVLPAGHPVWGEPERRAQVSARQHAVARRFRS